MKVLQLNNLDRTRTVVGEGFTSHRFLLMSDEMGFGLHKTVIPSGEKHFWHYKHHLEACYCISGYGVLSQGNNTWDIKPDTCYVLDKHDEHYFQAIEDTVLISVFNPPVIGDEIHSIDGSYAAPPSIDYVSMAEKLMRFNNVYDCAEYLKELNLKSKL